LGIFVETYKVAKDVSQHFQKNITLLFEYRVINMLANPQGKQKCQRDTPGPNNMKLLFVCKLQVFIVC
jgi:hypothetical protein